MGSASFTISPEGARIEADTPAEFDHVYETVKPVVAAVVVVGAAKLLYEIFRR